MFLVGSLTTIFPYLGTIFLMLVFHLVATPGKDYSVHVLFNEEKAIEYSLESSENKNNTLAHFCIKKDTQHLHHSLVIKEAYHAPNYQAPLQHPDLGKADGNKAPPQLNQKPILG